MIDSNWDRWIASSIYQAFSDSLSANYKIFVENQKIDPSVIQGDHLEFRLNGPIITEVSKDNFYIDVEINMLVVAQMEPDIWKIRRMAGDVAKAFANNICIHKLGNGVEDDQLLLGTMILDTNEKRSGVEITHFGQIDPTISVIYATVTGKYCMTL